MRKHSTFICLRAQAISSREEDTLICQIANSDMVERHHGETPSKPEYSNFEVTNVHEH